MLQIQTIENFTGFGDKNFPGEYYHSENLTQGQFGLEANISIVDESASGAGRFNWFTQYSSTPYAVDTTGKIFSRGSGWSSVRTPTASSGNGLITDQKGRLLYARNQFLGKYDGSWDDTWIDMTTISSELKPMDLYEDWVVIGNVNNIAVLNTTDDSFLYNSFTLPTGFLVRAIKSNQTGVLIGANFQNRSIIFLWDVRSPRSISEWIWLDHTIQSICKYGSRWIVTTQKGQFITDGYSIAPLPSIPDSLQSTITYRCVPAGTMVVGDKLLTANTDISLPFNRIKSGLYIQDLNTGLFNFVTVDNNCKSDMTMGALFQDSNFSQFISYTTNLPSSHHVGLITDQSPDSATLISPRLGIGANNKIAEGVRLDVSINPKVSQLVKSGSFTVSLKIYNFKRQLWGYGVTDSASSNANELEVNGTASGFSNAKIGDEVTVLTGANAGQVRHITNITNTDAAGEKWTLDSALPNNTESGAYLNVQPFQLVKTKTITISDLSELESIYFDIKNRIKGRKFLVKAVISSITNVSLTIPSLTFIYDDLGVIQ
jgi:hypothetical protein